MAQVKLDENVPDSVAAILRDRGHDVALARDEHLAGASDDQVLRVAVAEDRVLVTLDRDFTNTLRHSPVGTAGIIVLRLADQSVAGIRTAAIALTDLLAREATAGRLWILDGTRARIWPRDEN